MGLYRRAAVPPPLSCSASIQSPASLEREPHEVRGGALASRPFSWIVRPRFRGEILMKFHCVAAVAALTALPISAAHADEGMWTFDAFPSAKMRADYGWAPDQMWLDKVRSAALR